MAPHKIFTTVIILLLITVSSLNAAQILFTPSLFLSEEYTDNVNLDHENVTDDFITTAGITLNGQILGRTAGLELTYSPSYSIYQDNTTFDSWRHEASLHTWKEFKRNTRIELRNTFLQTNDPTDETASIDPDDPSQGPAIEGDPNRRHRNEYYTNLTEARLTQQFGSNDNFYLAYQQSLLRDVEVAADAPNDDNDISTPSAGLIYNFTTRWGIELDTTYAITDYDDDNRNDRNEFNGQIRLLHNFNRTLSGFLAYSYTTLDFDQEPDFTLLDPEEDYVIQRPSIGVRINFQNNAGITIDGGYYVQEFEESDNEEGFNVESDIFKRWEYRAGYLGINGSSGYVIDDDGIEDNGLTIYYEGGMTAGYRFTPRFTSNLFCTYRYEDFTNETPERVNQTLETGAGIDWQALQWMVVSLSYNYTNVISDDPTEEYKENSAIITIRMTPTTPYRLN